MKNMKKFSAFVLFFIMVGIGLILPTKAATYQIIGRKTFSTGAGPLTANVVTSHYTTGNTRWSHYEYASSSVPYKSATASAKNIAITDIKIRMEVSASMTSTSYVYGSGRGYITISRNGSTLTQTE